MIGVGKDELICDLAETYRIYDYRSLPVNLVATLSSGLGENSRIRRKMRGETTTITESLLAMIYDVLAGFLWNGEGNPPRSAYDSLNGIEPKEEQKQHVSFDTSDDYERERERLIAKVK